MTDQTPIDTSHSPMFEASNSARYERQARIERISKSTGRQLLCFVCGPTAALSRDDVVFFVDLLHDVAIESDIDLLLHTGGGDIDAAEKLGSLMRSRVGTKGRLRVIVPDYAKSAGTLIALGADAVVMSDSSELGPIDPQITLDDGRGNRIRHSILSYLDAYADHSEALRRNPDDVVAQLMLGKLDPSTVELFDAVRKRALSFAEKQLLRGMFRVQPGNHTLIPRLLMDTSRWQTHGQVIDSEEAASIGLRIEYMPPHDSVWQMLWRLYCLQRLAIRDGGKLFESSHVSLVEVGPD